MTTNCYDHIIANNIISIHLWKRCYVPINIFPDEGFNDPECINRWSAVPCLDYLDDYTVRRHQAGTLFCATDSSALRLSCRHCNNNHRSQQHYRKEHLALALNGSKLFLRNDSGEPSSSISAVTVNSYED